MRRVESSSLMWLKIGILAALVFALPTRTQAGMSSHLSDLAEDQELIQKQIDEKQEQIKNDRKLIAKIRSGALDQSADFPEFAGSCNNTCRPESSACTLELFQTLGISHVLDEPYPTGDKTSCYAIYKKRPDLDGIPSSCAEAVKECGDVAKDLKVDQLKAEIDSFQEEIKGLRQEKRELRAEFRDLGHTCPTCLMIESMRPREPKTMDYVLGGIQALAPVGTALIANGMQNNALGAYYSGYSNYLGVCSQAGIPCAPPAGAGLGFGLSGMGLMGSAMGMAMNPFAGAGLGLGISLGLPSIGIYGNGGFNPYGSQWGMNPWGMTPGINPYAMNPMAGIYGQMSPFGMMSPFGLNGGISLGLNGGLFGPGMNSWGMNPWGMTPGINPYAMNPMASLYGQMNPFGMMNPYGPYGMNGMMGIQYQMQMQQQQMQMRMQAQMQYQAQMQARYQQYQMMVQAQMQYQMRRYQQAMQAQQNLMIARQEMARAAARYQQVIASYQMMMGSSGYGYGYGFGNPWASIGGNLGIGLHLGAGLNVGLGNSLGLM